jgi:MFS family permease
MFIQQTFATLGRNMPPVIAPAIMDGLAVDHAWLGVYVSIAATSALFFQLGCGSFILRHGSLRMSQVSLCVLGVGLALAASGSVWLVALSAVLAGGGGALSTPASSHLLGRYATPRQAPLVFSLKQTAVPVGLLVAGLLGPLLHGVTGWQGALLFAAAGCIGFALMLQPLRRRFDADRVPGHPVRLSDMGTTLKVVLRDSGLRNLALACFAFSGLQTVFISYFVTYLVALGHDLAAAGLVFSIATFIAVPGRIVWGWIGGTRVTPGRLLGGLALGMAASGALLATTGPGWPLWLIGVVATALAGTALSWHGVLLAEAARLAPEGMRGAATGGVLSFGQIGGLSMPLLFSALLGATDSHAAGFVVSVLPSLAVGIVLLRSPR